MQPIITKKLSKDDLETGTNTTYSPGKKYMYQNIKKNIFKAACCDRSILRNPFNTN